MDAQTGPEAVVEMQVRRVPRYGVFMALGVLVGIVAALTLTYTGDFQPSPALGVRYSPSQVFGFLLLWLIPAGVALGAAVALILDRVARRHTRTVHAGHERIQVAPEPADETRE